MDKTFNHEMRMRDYVISPSFNIQGLQLYNIMTLQMKKEVQLNICLDCPDIGLDRSFVYRYLPAQGVIKGSLT